MITRESSAPRSDDLVSIRAPLNGWLEARPPRDAGPVGLSTDRIFGRIRQYRTLFLSDLHLGSRACRVDMLFQFLQRHHADNIFLVGDIFDIGKFHPVHWTSDHDRLLDCLVERRETGTSLVRLPGNHDVTLPPRRDDRAHRWADELGVGPASLVHEAVDGQRYLIAHGDFCDSALQQSSVVAQMGSCLDWLLRGCPTGIAKHATRALHRADSILTRSQMMRCRLISAVKEAGLDGIVCGHLHVPQLDAEQGVMYANCGDWVKNCTAIGEQMDGSFVLIDFINDRTVRLGSALSLRPVSSTTVGLHEQAA